LELQEKGAADDDTAEAEEEALRAIIATRRAWANKRQRGRGGGKGAKTAAHKAGGGGGGGGSGSGGKARDPSSRAPGRAAAKGGGGGGSKARPPPPRPPLRAVAAGERLADLPETDNGDLVRGGRPPVGAPAGRPVAAAAAARAAARGNAASGGPGAATAAAAGGPRPADAVDEDDPRADVPHFRGVPPSAVDAASALPSDVATHTNLTSLSHMLYRLVMTSGATSLLDVPCTSHAAWMPPLLSRLDYDIPNFAYTCMDAAGALPPPAAAAVARLAASSVVLNASYWAPAAPPLPAVDLVWSWGGLEGLPLDDAYAFFRRVAASGSRRLAVGNWPRLHNVVVEGAGGGHRHGRHASLGRPLPPAMNLRGSPFLFGAAERVIGGLDDLPANRGNKVEGQPTRKQLLVYDARKMRETW